MGYIYKITNQVNGKVYVGQTAHTIESRWKEHTKASKYRKYPLYFAMRKYGIENFSIEQIEECSIEQLNERERYWIAQYNSLKNGYNATTGGDNSFTFKVVTDDQFTDIKNMYLGGCTLKTVAETFHCDPATLSKLLKSMGVKIRRNGLNVNNYEKQKIIDMYNNGSSVQYLAREYQTSPTKMKEFLLEHNIDLRHRPKKEIDEKAIIDDFFAGMSFKHLEKKYHVDCRRIKDVLTKHNIDIKKCRFKGGLTQDQTLQLIKEYCGGQLSCRDIANKYDVNITTIYDILAYCNIDYRRYNITKSVQSTISGQDVLQQPQVIEEQDKEPA